MALTNISLTFDTVDVAIATAGATEGALNVQLTDAAGNLAYQGDFTDVVATFANVPEGTYGVTAVRKDSTGVAVAAAFTGSITVALPVAPAGATGRTPTGVTLAVTAV